MLTAYHSPVEADGIGAVRLGHRGGAPLQMSAQWLPALELLVDRLQQLGDLVVAGLLVGECLVVLDGVLGTLERPHQQRTRREHLAAPCGTREHRRARREPDPHERLVIAARLVQLLERLQNTGVLTDIVGVGEHGLVERERLVVALEAAAHELGQSDAQGVACAASLRHAVGLGSERFAPQSRQGLPLLRDPRETVEMLPGRAVVRVEPELHGPDPERVVRVIELLLVERGQLLGERQALVESDGGGQAHLEDTGERLVFTAVAVHLIERLSGDVACALIVEEPLEPVDDSGAVSLRERQQVSQVLCRGHRIVESVPIQLRQLEAHSAPRRSVRQLGGQILERRGQLRPRLIRRQDPAERLQRLVVVGIELQEIEVRRRRPSVVAEHVLVELTELLERVPDDLRVGGVVRAGPPDLFEVLEVALAEVDAFDGVEHGRVAGLILEHPLVVSERPIVLVEAGGQDVAQRPV